VPRRFEYGGSRPELDNAARVHDSHRLRHLADDSKVVRHVDRGDPARGAQIGDQPQKTPLRRDIEARGRLVEHDHSWLAGERHGNDDSLLLAAGELVREPTEEGPVGRKVDRREHVVDAPGHMASPRAATLVYSQDLVDLLSDPSDGVERRGRFLRDISDPASSQRRQLTLGHSQDLLSVEENLALCDVQAAPGVAEQGEGDRRLSRARFADQAEHFAECHVEVDLRDDIGIRPCQADLETSYPKSRRSVRGDVH
jgi:hypothetical protein